MADDDEAAVGGEADNDLDERADEQCAGGGEPGVDAHVVGRRELRDAGLEEDAEQRAPNRLDPEPQRTDPRRAWRRRRRAPVTLAARDRRAPQC